jgi:hypothetical protein
MSPKGVAQPSTDLDNNLFFKHLSLKIYILYGLDIYLLHT